jgi:hypothetical protein
MCIVYMAPKNGVERDFGSAAPLLSAANPKRRTPEVVVRKYVNYII